MDFNDPCAGCGFVPLSEEVQSDDQDGWQEDEVTSPHDIFVDADEDTPTQDSDTKGASLDGNEHPYVGLIVFDYPDGSSQRCAGTLMAPDVVVTAGHCTHNAVSGRIWFDSTEARILAKGYPNAGFGAYEFAEIYTSPDYDPDNFQLNDLGVAKLLLSVPTTQFGALPELGELTGMKPGGGKKRAPFTAVGHGLATTVAQPAQFPLTRMFARLRLHQIDGRGKKVGAHAMQLSNNPTGGILCVGDSGGPHFLGDSNVVAGITSYAKNRNCAGTVGAYRLDQTKDRDWLQQCLAGFCVGLVE